MYVIMGFLLGCWLGVVVGWWKVVHVICWAGWIGWIGWLVGWLVVSDWL